MAPESGEQDPQQTPDAEQHEHAEHKASHGTHAAAHRASHAVHKEAHKETEARAEGAFSPGFLQAVALVLGVLVIASAYMLGFQYGKLSVLEQGAVPSTVQAAAPAAQQAAAPAATPPPPSVTKSAKPTVELFVMSYCPYGLQMEKAYIPAWKLLGSKADMSIKWVDYSMHGLKEVQENIRQYCIQKEQPSKYLAYLTCFDASTDTASCQQQAGIDAAQLATCYNATDAQFGIMAGYNDQSTWLNGQFPQFNIDKQLNDQYGVQGSPTLVINGKQVNVARSAEAVKEAICAAFNNPPSECNTALSTSQEAAGPGAIGAGATPAGNAAAAAGCGS